MEPYIQKDAVGVVQVLLLGTVCTFIFYAMLISVAVRWVVGIVLVIYWGVYGINKLVLWFRELNEAFEDGK